MGTQTSVPSAMKLIATATTSIIEIQTVNLKFPHFIEVK